MLTYCVLDSETVGEVRFQLSGNTKIIENSLWISPSQLRLARRWPEVSSRATWASSILRPIRTEGKQKKQPGMLGQGLVSPEGALKHYVYTTG